MKFYIYIRIRIRMQKKHIINLQPIDVEAVKETYFKDDKHDVYSDTNLSHKTTEISELGIQYTNKIVSFLNEKNEKINCTISCPDFSANKLLMYSCFWCRHPFDTKPIGCPIRYIPRKAIKRYTSQISKDEYIIKENITKHRADVLTEMNDDSMTIVLTDYYETDGIFCSFNCCQAYINDNKHNRIYDYSSILLKKYYSGIFKTSSLEFEIKPAPSWRLLEPYGGHLNIVKFRENFDKVEYIDKGTILPKIAQIGIAYENRIII